MELTDRPTVGMRFELRSDPSHTIAPGAIVEIVAIQESWYNRHALIYSAARFEVELRVIESPERSDIGQWLRADFDGLIVRTRPPDVETYKRPSWLVPV